MQRQNTGAADVLPSPQPRDDGIENQRAANLNDVGFGCPAWSRPDPRERRRLMQACDGADADVVGAIGIETLTVRECADGDDVQGAGRLEQPVGILQKIARIFGHGLFETIAAARAAISGRDDDDDVELARQFVERGGPCADLAAVEDAPAVGKRDHEDPTAKALVQGRDRLAHLRGHEAPVVKATLVVHHFRRTKPRAALQCAGVELRTKIAEHGHTGHASAMTPDVRGAEIGRYADRTDKNIRQEWVIVDAAVDDADQRCVIGHGIQWRRIRHDHVERLCRGHVRGWRQIDRRDFLDRQQRAQQLARQTRAKHADRGADIAIKDIATSCLDVADDILKLALAEATFAQIPKLDVHQIGCLRDEILDISETFFPQAWSDPITRLDRSNAFDPGDEVDVGGVLLARGRAALIGVKPRAEIPHVFTRCEQHERAVRVAGQNREPEPFPLLLEQGARHLHAQDQRRVDKFGLAPASLFLGRGVELLAQLRRVLAAIARWRRSAAAVLAPLELLGKPDEFEVIVSGHGAPSSATRGETVLPGGAPRPPRRD